jgi:hypothetical protein
MSVLLTNGKKRMISTKPDDNFTKGKKMELYFVDLLIKKYGVIENVHVYITAKSDLIAKNFIKTDLYGTSEVEFLRVKIVDLVEIESAKNQKTKVISVHAFHSFRVDKIEGVLVNKEVTH